MHRIDTAGATVDGKFTDGDPALGIPATVLDDEWLNAVQEEIIAVMASQAQNPNKGVNTALNTAIDQKITASATALTTAYTSAIGANTTAIAAKVTGIGSSTAGRVMTFADASGKIAGQGSRLEADLVAGVASSVANEVALFSDTGGKTLTRAAGTGYAKLVNGVLQTPVNGVPSTEIRGRTDGGTQATGDIGEEIVAAMSVDHMDLSSGFLNVTGMSINLPAGTWLIFYTVGIYIDIQAPVSSIAEYFAQAGLYNATDSADIANSYSVQGNGFTNQSGTVVLRHQYYGTVTGQGVLRNSSTKTVVLRARYNNGFGTVNTARAARNLGNTLSGDDMTCVIRGLRIA